MQQVEVPQKQTDDDDRGVLLLKIERGHSVILGDIGSVKVTSLGPRHATLLFRMPRTIPISRQ